MHHILKLLNDLSPADLRELDESELRRLEALCEHWRILAEAESARRRALPRPPEGSR